MTKNIDFLFEGCYIVVVGSKIAPPAGIEPTLMVPETIVLSVELRRQSFSYTNIRIFPLSCNPHFYYLPRVILLSFPYK